MMTMGVVFGPVEHYWYRYLDRKLPGVSRIIVCKKVFIDEAVFGVSSVAVFFYGKNDINNGVYGQPAVVYCINVGAAIGFICVR